MTREEVTKKELRQHMQKAFVKLSYYKFRSIF